MDKHKKREKQVELKSYRFSWIGVTLVISILMIVRFYHDEPIADLMLIVLAQLTSRAFYQFLNIKDTYHTLTFILTLGALLLGIFALLSVYGVY